MERELLEEKGLSRETVDLIGQYVQLSGGVDLVEKLASDQRLAEQEEAQAALADMRLLLAYCSTLGISDRIRFDLSLARGLDYYTGVIYEAVLTGKKDVFVCLMCFIIFPHLLHSAYFDHELYCS